MLYFFLEFEHSLVTLPFRQVTDMMQVPTDTMTESRHIRKPLQILGGCAYRFRFIVTAAKCCFPGLMDAALLCILYEGKTATETKLLCCLRHDQNAPNLRVLLYLVPIYAVPTEFRP